ncbi:MAG: MBL fold metallo-hydrolase, partial [Lachnospiraceae bacterium]|nr:MBL fold metallo-hydrolase [Lachnospiraceae bacterium]
PDPFCRCFLCSNARIKGGKDVRKRSMFRVNEHIAIDMGADSFTQAIEYGDFINLEHVLITHTHEDHLAYMMMGVRKMATHRTDNPLNYYFTDDAYEIVNFYRKNSAILKNSINALERDRVIAFHKLEFGEACTVGNLPVIPLKGNHIGNMGESCANYVIRLGNGKMLYYALDTGYYLDETFMQLKSYKLDYIISECTYGNMMNRPQKPNGHLDVFSCQAVFKRLLEQETIGKDTQIYLTHINHAHTATHNDLVMIFGETDIPCDIHVAYDGMQITG